MLRLQTTSDKLFAVEVTDLSILWIVGLIPVPSISQFRIQLLALIIVVILLKAQRRVILTPLQTLKLMRVLHRVRRLGQEQPTLQVVPTEAFERQLNGTLTTNLIHKALWRSQELSRNMLHRIIHRIDTITESVDSINSRHGRTIAWFLLEVVGTVVGTSNSCSCLSIHQIDIGQTHVRNIGLKCPIPVIPLVTDITLVRNQLLNEVTRATCIIHGTHSTTGIQVAVLEFLLLSIQFIKTCLSYILETIEYDIVIETWVTILEWVLGIKARVRIFYQNAILNQVDRLTISHTVLVNEVSCRLVNNVIMLHETSNLRTKQLSTVPRSRVYRRTNTTEDSLRNAWHTPVILSGIEDVRIVIRCIFTIRSLSGNMVVDVIILVISEFVRYSTLYSHVKCLTKSFSSQLGILHIVVIGLAIRAGIQELSNTTILGLLKLLHQR